VGKLVVGEGAAPPRGRISCCSGTPEPTDDHTGQQTAYYREKSIQSGPPGR
jgi:hypothetical protein